VLEVFGEHTLSGREILGLLLLSFLLLAGYGFHARAIPYPLLNMSLFRVRTFRSAVLGSFWTRLGIGGIPFLFPLLYQVGLGFTPVQSGLLMMPQAFAAMSLKLTMPGILTRFGYRRVLISNTVALGVMLGLFATIGPATPVWLIVTQVFCYGFLTSLQYTSMNTLAYADVQEAEASSASSIASTGQQMSISFGVATASLAAAIFIPDHASAGREKFVLGIHQAFMALGGLTALSALLFRTLKDEDGQLVSQHRTGVEGD
jgi:fucose permease